MAVPSITVNGPTGNDIVDTGRGKDEATKGVQNKVTPDMINTALTGGRTTKTDGGKVDEKKINDERGKDKGIRDVPSDAEGTYNKRSGIPGTTIPVAVGRFTDTFTDDTES